MNRMLGALVGLVIFLATATFLALRFDFFFQWDHHLLNALVLPPSSKWFEVTTLLHGLFDFWPSLFWLIGLGLSAGYLWGVDAILEFAILGAGVMFFSRFETIAYLQVHPEMAEHLIPVSALAFPSAHALRAAGLLVGFLAVGWSDMTKIQRRWQRAGALTLVVIAAFSEILLAANYPSSVVAGVSLSVAWALGLTGFWLMRAKALPE